MPLDALLTGLRAGGDATRLRLLMLLSNGDLNVKDLTEILGQSQPRVSRHLRLLNEAHLVERFREGAWAFYRLAEAGAAAALARAIVEHLSIDDPVVARDQERLAAVKEQRAKEAADYFSAHAADWDRVRTLHIAEAEVERAMLELAGEGPFERMLDVGTGTGRLLEMFAPFAQRAVGIDLSRDMLAYARANLEKAGLDNCQVRQGDLFNLRFEPQSFDFITIHLVLHFLDDPARAVREAARLLAPGGHLLIVDFAPHELEFLREEHAHRRLGFSLDQVGRWIEASGLELRDTRELASPNGGEERPLTVNLWRAAARA